MFDTKKQLMWSKLRVGMIITITLLVIFVAAFFIGDIQKIFLPQIEIEVQIPDAKGLRKGAPVWLLGIEIGSVINIDLHPTYGTITTLAINKKDLPFVKKDSVVSIHTIGLLGDRLVELSPGSPDAEPIGPGDILKGTAQIEIMDIMEAGIVSAQKMGELAEKLGEFVVMIERGEGTIGRFFTDPSIYDNLNEVTKNLSHILKNIEGGKGSLGMLINDPSLYNKLLAAASSIEETSIEFSERTGKLIFTTESSIEKLSKRLNVGADKLIASASSLEEFTEKLNTPSGTLRRLAEDPELYENLNSATKHLSLILERIYSGEGTVGTLIKDKELAIELRSAIEELRELTKDIRENPERYFHFSIF